MEAQVLRRLFETIYVFQCGTFSSDAHILVISLAYSEISFFPFSSKYFIKKIFQMFILLAFAHGLWIIAKWVRLPYMGVNNKRICISIRRQVGKLGSLTSCSNCFKLDSRVYS